MAAALEPAVDQNELFLDGLGVVEWINDHPEYKCTRCKKILVQHYIANCDHKFCNNCKRVVDDGSQHWRCPRCNEFIKEIGRQDFKFRDRVHKQKLHCPNRKYGCDQICTFKQLKEHLKRCEHTRESILPVPYTGEPMPDTLVELHQLRWEVKEMKQKMVAMEKMCVEREVDAEQKGVNESAWELNIIMNEMKREMEEIKKKQKEGKWKLRVKLSQVNDRIDGVKSDLHVDTTRLRNEIIELQKMRNDSSAAVKGISLAVEESKAKILKLEGKTDAYYEIIEFNNKRNNDVMHQLKNEFNKELETKIENEMKSLDERTKVTIVTETDKMMAEMIKIVDEKANEKENLMDTNKEIEIIKDKNNQMAEQVEFIKQEMEFAVTNVEAKMKRIISPFSVKIEEKMSEWKTEITQLEEKTQQNQLLLLQFNKSPEFTNLEKQGFNLKKFIRWRFTQMNGFTLALNNDNFQPDFTWKVIGITSEEEGYEIKSETFQWTAYPIQAQAKIEMASAGQVDMSLRLDVERQAEEEIDLHLIPRVYFVFRDRTKTNANGPKHICRTSDYYFNSKFDYSFDFYSRICHKSKLVAPIYTVEDSIVVDIYVEPPAMARQVYSYNGTLNCAIDHYQKRRRMVEQGLVLSYESPYFYTGPKGYRVRVTMRLVGRFEAYVDFLPGEFDVDLPSTFPHTTTVILFHRKEAQRNMTKTVDKNIRANKYYSIDLCDGNEIENYVMNDTLFFKVAIIPSN